MQVKNAGVAGYAEAFLPVHSDSQANEWYSYFENDVLAIVLLILFKMTQMGFDHTGQSRHA